MSQIILDFGSGNTCRNSVDYAKKMINALDRIDNKKHEVIIKWQLFENPSDSGGGSLAGKDIRLFHDVFYAAYFYANSLGYKCTSSVFDEVSLAFLLQFDVPFIKIACRPKLYWLIGAVPREIPVYVSIDVKCHDAAWANPTKFYRLYDAVQLRCVPKYPAEKEESRYQGLHFENYSDHTSGLDLWYEQQPAIWEKHFCLESDLTNPDSGPFAVTPEQLKEIL